MEIKLPADCGNSPRVGIISDFLGAWASKETEKIKPMLKDDFTWTIAGRGECVLLDVMPAFDPSRLIVSAIANHGRIASCLGVLAGDEKALEFSHHFRFSGASKTALLVEIKSFFVVVAPPPNYLDL